MKKNILVLSGIIIGFYSLITLNFGCAQVSAPTGGPKDTLAPRLVKAVPEMNTVNFTGNKVNLSFDEYINLEELQGNVVVSPLQKKDPSFIFDRKSISIKFKDTLQPNTTYSVNFGNSLKDVHEGNILRSFTYVFSTGDIIDSLTIEGKIILAETGKADSTVFALLYRNTEDTAVLKIKPDYIAKPDGEGHFKFRNLPHADFKIYALKDGDGGKTYNSKTEIFAFNDSVINSLENNRPVILYAYAGEKDDRNKPSGLKPVPDKKLKYTNSLSANKQDILLPFELNFNNPLKKFDSLNLVLSDTNYKRLPNYSISIDSSRKKITVKTKWQPETDYVFIVPKESVDDSAGNLLPKTDTFFFKTKRTEDYGRIILRFPDIDLAKHPVIQFLEGENVKYAYPLVAAEWSNKLFPPGDYLIRILFDLNNNGVWDPGDYSKKIQPEKAIQLTEKLAIKANWDNERDVKLASTKEN